ncbi:plastocyanin/azurin family copper-binding protein [Natranaeroarchaeum sulfidigenes]|uniref:plastocyanin/azurin family copper-binding protein n=1 Tax=Natranaeroarchaeum sulfidigenes TaxID=2784880 RepID=UPI001EE51DE7|nr:plastocyanin/azurin family copper-binding protein [Natranaeroarchaeum sulfidigenes]
MNRRDFLRTATGASAGAAAVSAVGTTAAADGHDAYSAVSSLQEEDDEENGEEENGEEENGEEENGEENGAADNGDDDGATETVIVGPDGENVFEPDDLTIEPGTTVEFIWESDTHNLALESGPDGGWEGYDPIEDTGFEYEHTFEVEGTYEYVCDPHVAAGMDAVITVTEDAGDAAAEGPTEVDPHAIGVPVQKHFIGAATFAAIFVTFVFTFYVLKYGESANTSYPNKKE